MKRTYEELEEHCHDLEALLAEATVDVLDVVRYTTTIAPKTADLPPIMTMCTPAERRKFVSRYHEKYVNGVWTGKSRAGISDRPCMSLQTERCLQEQLTGERSQNPRKERPNTPRKGAQINVAVTHIALISVGRFPTERRNVASHICHVSSCIEPTHLIWESSGDNWRRERLCSKQGRGKVCTCGLFPPCNFALHPEFRK